MNNIEVYIVVEGQTEQTFVREVLAPEMSHKGVFLYPVLIGKPGHKGGDVRFERAKIDIVNLLKQRQDTCISTMFDYFGIEADWPGNEGSLGSLPAARKAEIVEAATFAAIGDLFPNHRVEGRFIPYIEMYEFEALLFSDASKLAKGIGVNAAEIEDILDECQEPEEINDGPNTAPSKRLKTMIKGEYRKITMGKTISEEIGIQTIREKCPHFNAWLTKLEQLVEGTNG